MEFTVLTIIFVPVLLCIVGSVDCSETTGHIYALSFPNKPNSLSQFVLYLTVTNQGSQSVTVDVIFNAGDYAESSDIGASTDVTFELPSTVFLPASNGVTNKTVFVCTTGEVSLYGFIAESKDDSTVSSDSDYIVDNPWDRSIRGAFLGLPAHALGTEYYIPAYPREGDFTTVFTLTAVEDDTNVSIRFTVTSGSTALANRNFVLQSGDSYQVLVKEQVIRSEVDADKPVTILAASKSETHRVFLLKHVLPKESFGTTHVLTPFETSCYDYCVVASETTSITKCEVTKTSQDSSSTDCLAAEEMDDVMCVEDVDANVYLKITSTHPVAVYQYLKGYSVSSSDSSNIVCLAMSIITPVDNYLTNVAYSAIGDGNVDIKAYIVTDTITSFDINGEEQDLSVFGETQVVDFYVYTKALQNADVYSISPNPSDAQFMVVVNGGHRASGTVIATTTAATMTTDFEGSGSGFMEEVTSTTPAASDDVIHGQYESLFAYPAQIGSYYNESDGTYSCLLQSTTETPISTTITIAPTTKTTAKPSTTEFTTTTTPLTTQFTSSEPTTTQPTTQFTSTIEPTTTTVTTEATTEASVRTASVRTTTRAETNLAKDIDAIVNGKKEVDPTNVAVTEETVEPGKHTIESSHGSKIQLTTRKEVQAEVVEVDNAEGISGTEVETQEGPPAFVVGNILSIVLRDENGTVITVLEVPIVIENPVENPALSESDGTTTAPEQVSTQNVIPICAWWDPDNNIWNNDGCKVKAVNGNTVVCKCDHLTIFSVLMEVTEFPITSTDERILTVLTKVGLSLSIIALAITIFIYIYCRLYTSHRFLIHGNLALALLISHLLFVSGIEVNKHSEQACTAITWFMHLFFMATFFWMLVEGLYLALSAISTLTVNSRPLQQPNIHFAVWAVIGWVPALLIVIISSAARIDGYGYPIYEFDGPSLTTRYRCWLNPYTGLVWAFVGPACVILATNLFILILVMYTLCTLKTEQDDDKIQKMKSGIRIIFVLGTILGLPWILGLLNLDQYTVAVSYLFVLGNAFQGVWILFSLCIFDKEVRQVLATKQPIRTVLNRPNSRNSVAPERSSSRASSAQRPLVSSRASTPGSTVKEAWTKEQQQQQQQQQQQPQAATKDTPGTSRADPTLQQAGQDSPRSSQKLSVENEKQQEQMGRRSPHKSPCRKEKKKQPEEDPGINLPGSATDVQLGNKEDNNNDNQI